MEPHLWFPLGWFWGQSPHSPHLANFHIMNKSESIQGAFLFDETKPGHMLQSYCRCNGLSAWGQTRSNLKLSEVQLMQILPKHQLFMSKNLLLLACVTWERRQSLSVHLHSCLDTAVGQAAWNSCALAAASKPLQNLFASMGFGENKMSSQQPSPKQGKLGFKKGIDLRLGIFGLAPCGPALSF